jgi:hypothetical protein
MVGSQAKPFASKKWRNGRRIAVITRHQRGTLYPIPHYTERLSLERTSSPQVGSRQCALTHSAIVASARSCARATSARATPEVLGVSAPC